MDFRDTPEEASFRAEVRSFVKDHSPELKHQGGEWGSARVGADLMWGTPDWRSWMDALAARGWISPTWPVEYGGAGLTHVHQFILHEEMAWASTPRPEPIGQMIGATMLLFGTEEQKRQHVPKIAHGDVIWCQGFSEPGSGSDLASVQTRAVRDGDDYVITGQKIWTSWAHLADWIHLIARTDPTAPKHKGLSYFIMPVKTPGITIRPLNNMVDQHEFNEVFFENVRVPAGNRLGEEGRGWYYAATLLDFERSMVGNAVDQVSMVDELLNYSRANGASRSAITELVERRIEAEVGRWLSYRVMSVQKQGRIPNHEASIVKTFLTELDQRTARTGMKVLGLRSTWSEESDRIPLRGRVARMYLHTVASTLGGGTSEIQRNIIATRGLALPR
jgi:alkylation response protein AidB-like acyl-CoA dehydrogenase